MLTKTLRIAPSILAADLMNLGDEISSIEQGGADLVHIDVMDGRFVPNLSLGIPTVRALKRVTEIPLDVHLMILEPERHIAAFVEAGASMISVHVEASPHLHRTLGLIRELGAKAGVALNPSTPLSALEWVVDQLDFIVVMSVNPGFAGQVFIPASTNRVRETRKLLDDVGSDAAIEIDGGLNIDNVGEAVVAGADIIVAASSIFGKDEPSMATRELRQAALNNANFPHSFKA